MYKCREKNAQIEWLRKKNIYKNKNKTLYSKIHKKISLGEYSGLRKKEKKKTISIQVIIRKTLGVKQKKGTT